MFRKVLAAMDSSAIGNLVFAEALDLAKAINADLMLLHVLSPEEETSPEMPPYPVMGYGYYPVMNEVTLEEYQRRWEAYEARSLDWLRSRTETATSAGIRTEFTQVAGDPGRAICALARNWEADLIVVGRRGRSGLSELILGSVSNYVLHHAPCSVMAVQTTVHLPAHSQVELAETAS
jgi:nucleotide-binding universal stress UspA family protein